MPGVRLDFVARFFAASVRFSNTISSAIRNSMIPPAIRNASRLMPSVPSKIFAEQPKDQQGSRLRRRWRGWPSCGDAWRPRPGRRLAKMGAQPGGSMTTKSVTKAERNSAIIDPPVGSPVAAMSATTCCESGDRHGATPPGTGRIHLRSSGLRNRQRLRRGGLAVFGRNAVDADIDYSRARLNQSPLIISGRPTAATTMSPPRTISGEILRTAMSDRDGAHSLSSN